MNEVGRRRTLLLTEAKDLLLKESNGIQCHGPDDGDIVNRFTSLYDRLCDGLSNEKAEGNNKTIEMAPPRQGRHDEMTTQQTLQTEWNLYRALWVTCIVVIDLTERIATTLVDNNENDSRLKWQTNLLRQTARQCSCLTKILEETILCWQGEGSSTEDQTLAQDRDMTNVNGDHDDDDDNALWERLVHWWTVETMLPQIRQDEGGIKCNGIEAENGYRGSDSGEDDILMFTKEQLVEEEQELLQMASAPIPIVTTRPPTSDRNATTNEVAAASTSLRLAEARLVLEESERRSSSSTSLTSMPKVTWDPRGIIVVHSSASASKSSVSPWYGLTSESDISYATGAESKTVMKITNVVAAEKDSDIAWSWTVVEAITLSVLGQDGLLQWWEVISRLIVHLQGKNREQQQEVARLWTPEQLAVVQAETKQRRDNSFIGGRPTG